MGHFTFGPVKDFLLLTFVTLVYLLLKYATHVPHSDTAASAWVVPCEGVLPSQIELVGSIARLFQNVFSDRLPIAGQGGPTVMIHVREDG